MRRAAGQQRPRRSAARARTNASAAARSSAAEDRNATRSTRMVRRRSSSAAAASDRASASAWPYSTMVAIPRTRSRKRACSRASARNWRREAAAAPIPAAAIASGTSSPHRTSTSAAIGSASSAAKRHDQRAGNRQHRGRQPAREQPVQRLDPIDHDRGQFAGVLRAQHARDRHAAGATAHRCAAVAAPPHRHRRPRGRQQPTAPPAAAPAPRSHQQRQIGTPGRPARPRAPRPHIRPGRSPSRCPPGPTTHRPRRTIADALLAAQPGAWRRTAGVRRHRGVRLPQPKGAAQRMPVNCRQYAKICRFVRYRRHSRTDAPSMGYGISCPQAAKPATEPATPSNAALPCPPASLAARLPMADQSSVSPPWASRVRN